ncbi:SPW repeat protein [Actinoalloteichus spitiensis]|uniref:SPW repeat protein n=1 Tax=Actinoalloteichus spitiensis TaxID=252394 RepID=UPI000309E410|nr:SPW repeat protein [Actinoalloteichus spitiensis]
MTGKWSRWQDWAAFALGVYTVISTIWLDVTAGTAWTMIVLGALLAASGLWSLAAPGSVASEWTHMLFGVLLFLAPWVIGYTEQGGAAWTSWIVGVLTVLVSAAALPEANTAHRGVMAH